MADVSCPVLAIWGIDDTFLPPLRSSERLRKYLTEAGHQNWNIQLFEGAGHYLTTGSAEDEFVEGYLELLEDWLRELGLIR